MVTSNSCFHLVPQRCNRSNDASFRWLVARKGDVSHAAKDLTEHAAWRAKNFPNGKVDQVSNQDPNSDQGSLHTVGPLTVSEAYDFKVLLHGCSMNCATMTLTLRAHALNACRRNASQTWIKTKCSIKGWTRVVRQSWYGLSYYQHMPHGYVHVHESLFSTSDWLIHM